jgi:hypothetical protein
MAAIFVSSLKRRPKATEEQIQMLTLRMQKLISRFPREKKNEHRPHDCKTVCAGFPTSTGKWSECVNLQVDNVDMEPVTAIEGSMRCEMNSR